MSEQGRQKDANLLEIEQVLLDPVVSGFEGVVMQLEEEGGLYTLREVSVCTGNSIFTITSRDEVFIKSLFRRDLEGYRELQDLRLSGCEATPSQKTRRPT